MKNLPTSALRHRITVRKPVTQVDEYGQTLNTYTSLGVFPASVVAKNTTEMTSGDRLTQFTTYEITVRYNDNIQHNDLITLNGRTYTINTVVDPTGERKYSVLNTSLSTKGGLEQ